MNKTKNGSALSTMIKYTLNSIAILFLIISCSDWKNSEKTSIANFTTIHALELSDCNVLPYSEIFDSIQLIKLETNEECLIGQIDMILYHKDKYYILDKAIGRGVYVFDDKGKYSGKIGKIGKGPEEIMSFDYMAISATTDEILIYDNLKSKILTYGLDGSYHSSFQLKARIYAFTVLGPDKYAVYYNYYGNEHLDVLPRHNFQVINSRGEVLFEDFDRTNSNTPDDVMENCFYKFKDEILFHPSFDNSIYTVINDNISVKYLFDFGERTLDNEFISGIVNDTQDKGDIYEKIYNSDKCIIKGFYESDNYVVLTIECNKISQNIFYSKTTGEVKYATSYINDIYGLITGVSITGGINGDKFISYVQPSDIPLDYYKSLMKNALNDDQFIKREFLKNINDNPMQMGGCSDELKKIVSELDLSISKDEYEAISSININDNPVLIVHTLKHM